MIMGSETKVHVRMYLTYVPTLDMHTCTCLVPYMRFPVQKLLVLMNYFLASYMGNMN